MELKYTQQATRAIRINAHNGETEIHLGSYTLIRTIGVTRFSIK